MILAFPPHQRKSNKWIENEGGLDLVNHHQKNNYN
jgi:hypothetical protein